MIPPESLRSVMHPRPGGRAPFSSKSRLTPYFLPNIDENADFESSSCRRTFNCPRIECQPM
jgi:hypothetical protein